MVFLLEMTIIVMEWSSFVLLTMLLIKKNVVSAYMIDSVSLWHGKLAHIGINTMKG